MYKQSNHLNKSEKDPSICMLRLEKDIWQKKIDTQTHFTRNPSSILVC